MYANRFRKIGSVNIGVLIACGVGLIAVIALARYVIISRQPAQVHIAASDWERQKALECQGHMTKLSMDDQHRLIATYGLPAAPSRIANLYRTINNPQ